MGSQPSGISGECCDRRCLSVFFGGSVWCPARECYLLESVSNVDVRNSIWTLGTLSLGRLLQRWCSIFSLVELVTIPMSCAGCSDWLMVTLCMPVSILCRNMLNTWNYKPRWYTLCDLKSVQNWSIYMGFLCAALSHTFFGRVCGRQQEQGKDIGRYAEAQLRTVYRHSKTACTEEKQRKVLVVPNLFTGFASALLRTLLF